jgi:hypothetical protein
MGARSKRAQKIRTASEFDLLRLTREAMAPKTNAGAYAWTLDAIKSARDQQMAGRFHLPARMAEGMRTDDALYVAFEQRLAPQENVEVAIEPAKGARGDVIAAEADALYGPKGVAVHPDTLTDINGALANHGIAVASTTPIPRADGSRIDYAMKAWPMEYVRWDGTARAFKTQTEGGVEETIVHGDGRWLIFQRHEIEPWKYGALLPAALVWARHAFSLRDWAKSSVAHGNAKVVGEMPLGMPLQNAEGELTREAAAFLALLLDLGGDGPAGIRPAGSKTDFVANTSTAWQVFDTLSQNAEKAAARIYLGTDGILGSQGGAPGVDITALFGVARTRVEADLNCIERGLNTLIEIWTAINFGDSTLAPKRRYLLPDEDLEAELTQENARYERFFGHIERARKNGFEITPDYVEAVAKAYRVKAPTLKVTAPAPAPGVVSPPAEPPGGAAAA